MTQLDPVQSEALAIVDGALKRDCDPRTLTAALGLAAVLSIEAHFSSGKDHTEMTAKQRASCRKMFAIVVELADERWGKAQ